MGLVPNPTLYKNYKNKKFERKLCKMAKVKKINEKEIVKNEVMEIISNALADMGLTIDNGENYGFTKGTIVVRHDKCDIQIKPITPKAGVTRYEELAEEEE